jgi:hypothetical protein
MSIECTTSANSTVTCLYSAGVVAVATGAPHSLQNFEFGGNSVPHDPQTKAAAVTSRGRPTVVHINIVSPPTRRVCYIGPTIRSIGPAIRSDDNHAPAQTLRLNPSASACRVPVTGHIFPKLAFARVRPEWSRRAAALEIRPHPSRFLCGTGDH